MILSIAVSIPLFALPGLDAIRYQWSHVPLLFKITGFVGTLISSGLIFWALKTNPYSSAAVEIQKDRGHRVIMTGPYQFVRHPMYVGAILWFLFTPPGSRLLCDIHSRCHSDGVGRGADPPGRQDLAAGPGWIRCLCGNGELPAHSGNLVDSLQMRSGNVSQDGKVISSEVENGRREMWGRMDLQP